MTDLELAFAALKGKQTKYTDLWNYYDGNQPLVYSTRRLREVFQDIDARFSQNWCAVVIDAATDRIALKEFSVSGNADATKRLNDLFDETDLDLDADDVHKAAAVIGESFVIAWKNEDGEKEAYYNDPRLVHVEYEKDNPRKKRFAAKWWQESDKTWRITLYYADRLEYYATARPYDKAGDIREAKYFVAAETPTADNPYGEIPVFHFKTEGRTVKSDLANVIEPQNAVNKLEADMMVSAEFGAFKQRWVISNQGVSDLKNSPKNVWDLPAGDGQGQPTSVGEFSETNLNNFLDAIDRQANFISTVSRTPKHYLSAQNGTPSGEALIAMEAPLNKRCEHHIKRFKSTWQKLGSFLLKLDGLGVKSGDILPIFDDPATVQPRTEAEIRQINSQATVPLETTLRWEGKSQEEIDKVKKEKKDEQAAAPAPAPTQPFGLPAPGADMRAQAATLRAQARQAIADRGNGVPMPPIGKPVRAMSKV